MRRSLLLRAVSSAAISCISTLGLLCVALLPGGGLAAIHGNLPGILLAGLGSVCLGAFTAYLLLGKSPGKALDALEQAMRFLAQNDGKSRFEPLDAFHGSLKPISDALEELRIRCRDNYERLHGLLDGIHLPFLLVDTQERVQFTNELLLSMLEIDGGKEKQYGRTLSEVFYNDPSRKTMVGRAMNNRENVPARGGHTRP